MGKLTEKREKFVLHWVKSGNKSEAYRAAYKTSGWKSSTVNVKASELSKNGKVLVRYGELTAESQKRNNTTIDSTDSMLKEAFDMAKGAATPTAMVSAVMGLIKLHGLDAETRHKVKPDGEDEEPTTSVKINIVDAS